MSYAVGWDKTWARWIGYGVPGTCDQQGCDTPIDRGMGYRCQTCGLHYCAAHLRPGPERHAHRGAGECQVCRDDTGSQAPSPDTAEWLRHITADPSWQQWRDANPAKAQQAEIELIGHDTRRTT